MSLLFAVRRGTAPFVVVTALAAALVWSPPQAIRSASPEAGLDLVRATAEEGSMRAKINGARSSSGRVRLRMNSTLVTVARRHAQRMASAGKIYHNPRLASQVRLPWRILGENVGVGQTVATLHTAFMNSPPHRRNVLDRRFRQLGVGIIHAAGRTWVVVVFYG